MYTRISENRFLSSSIFRRETAAVPPLSKDARLLRPRGHQDMQHVLLLRGGEVQHDHVPGGPGVLGEDGYMQLAGRGAEEGLRFQGAVQLHVPESGRGDRSDAPAIPRHGGLPVLLRVRERGDTEEERVQVGASVRRADWKMRLGEEDTRMVSPMMNGSFFRRGSPKSLKFSAKTGTRVS